MVNTFSGRMLFDPPLCKPGRSYQEMEAAATRQRLPDPPSFRALSKDGGLFLHPQFHPDVLQRRPGVVDLMAETTLRRREGDQDYELRCPREYEARIVEYAGVFSVMVDFRQSAVPDQSDRRGSPHFPIHSCRRLTSVTSSPSTTTSFRTPPTSSNSKNRRPALPPCGSSSKRSA